MTDGIWTTRKLVPGPGSLLTRHKRIYTGSHLLPHSSLSSVTWSLKSHYKPGVSCFKRKWNRAGDHPTQALLLL